MAEFAVFEKIGVIARQDGRGSRPHFRTGIVGAVVHVGVRLVGRGRGQEGNGVLGRIPPGLHDHGRHVFGAVTLQPDAIDPALEVDGQLDLDTR